MNMLYAFLHQIDRIDDRWCRNNLFGTVGYKGTISTRIQLRCGSVLVFITSHFFAEERLNKERINQYKNSLHCTFPEDKSNKKFVILFYMQFNNSIKFRFVFWQGDMNFRVEGFTNSAHMIALLNNAEDPNELANIADAYDQLKKAKRLGQIFTTFEEEAIKFKPTYRILVRKKSGIWSKKDP